MKSLFGLTQLGLKRQVLETDILGHEILLKEVMASPTEAAYKPESIYIA